MKRIREEEEPEVSLGKAFETKKTIEQSTRREKESLHHSRVSLSLSLSLSLFSVSSLSLSATSLGTLRYVALLGFLLTLEASLKLSEKAEDKRLGNVNVHGAEERHTRGERRRKLPPYNLPGEEATRETRKKRLARRPI